MLFLLTTGQDFFACLFAILGMQAMHRYSPRVVGALMGFSALLIFGALFEQIGLLQALALALVYTTLGAFMTAYIWSTRRAEVVSGTGTEVAGRVAGCQSAPGIPCPPAGTTGCRTRASAAGTRTA